MAAAWPRESSLATLGSTAERSIGPTSINHVGQLQAVTVSFNLAPGVALGDATAVEAAISKVFATEALWRTSDEALQVAGGNGYMAEFPYERLMRDSRINRADFISEDGS